MCFLPFSQQKLKLAVCVSYGLLYLVKIGGNEGDGVTSSCHFDETTVHSVPHWSVLIHTVEQITQPMKKIKQNCFSF